MSSAVAARGPYAFTVGSIFAPPNPDIREHVVFKPYNPQKEEGILYIERNCYLVCIALFLDI
jgi:hypothetical protein